MNDKIIEFIKKEWRNNFSKELGKKPSKLSYVQISQSHSKDFDKSRIVLLIFNEGESPILVAKFAKDKNYEKTLLEERMNFQSMNRNAKKDIFPRIYSKTVINEKLVVFEEYIEGTNLDAYVRDKLEDRKTNVKEVTEEVFQIVIDLLNDLNAGRVLVKDRKIVLKEFNEFQEYLIKNKKIEKGVLNRIKKSAKLIASSDAPVYKGVINFDFVSSNIIKSKIPRMIDLEFARKSSLSFLGPLRFFYYYINTLTEVGVLDTRNFSANLGIIARNENHWLRKIIKKYFGKLLDIDLLHEYFLVELVHDMDLQLEVDYDSQYDLSYFDNTYDSLTGLNKFLIKLVSIEEKQNKVLKTEYDRIKEAKGLESIELVELRFAWNNIQKSRAWKLFTLIQKVKNKILR